MEEKLNRKKKQYAYQETMSVDSIFRSLTDPKLDRMQMVRLPIGALGPASDLGMLQKLIPEKSGKKDQYQFQR